MSSFLRQKANQARSLVHPRERLDVLSGPTGQRPRVVDPDVDAGHCYTHMCLLEKFAWERRRLARLAAERGFDERLLWVYYVNAASDRFVAWMRASLRRNVESLVPPLDVVLVWYALMQDPVQWARIADIIGTRVVSWKWSVMAPTMEGRRWNCHWPLPGQSENIIPSILGHSDLLARIGEVFPLGLDHGITSGSTISTVGAASCRPVDYLTPSHVFTVGAAGETPQSVPFNVHAAVDRHLEYAQETLRYSWHRMPGMMSRRHAGDFLGGAVARYAKFMTLVSLWAALKTLPPFDGPDCFLWPAPDVELVWRTHMLNAPEFGAFSAALRWVRPVPAVPQVRGEAQRKATARAFEYVFRCPYEVCPCWDCMSCRGSGAAGSGGGMVGSGRRRDGRTSEMREAAVRVHEDRQRLADISVEIDFGLFECTRVGRENTGTKTLSRARQKLLSPNGYVRSRARNLFHGGEKPNAVVNVDGQIEVDGSQKQKQQRTSPNDRGSAPARPPSSPGVPVVKPAAVRQPLEDPYFANEEERIAAKEWEAKILLTPAEHWFRQCQCHCQDQDDCDDGGVGQGAATEVMPSALQESLSEYVIFARYLTEERGSEEDDSSVKSKDKDNEPVDARGVT